MFGNPQEHSIQGISLKQHPRAWEWPGWIMKSGEDSTGLADPPSPDPSKPPPLGSTNLTIFMLFDLARRGVGAVPLRNEAVISLLNIRLPL